MDGTRDGTKLVCSLRSPYFEVWITDELDSIGSSADAFKPNLAAYDEDILALYTRVIEANPQDANNVFRRAGYYEFLQDVNNARADTDSYYALLRGRDAQPSGFRFGLPENLGPAVNTSTHENHPLLAHDGLSLLFSRRNPEGSYDLWKTTRESNEDPWKPAEICESFKPDMLIPGIMTEDGRELYLSKSGEYGDSDIFVRKRVSVENDWGDPENLGPIVNSSACERRVVITGDGLELYFIDHYRAPRPGGCGGRDIWMTRRRTRDAPWEKPKNLGPPVNSSSSDGWPYITPDGLLLLFASHRPGGIGAGDLYVTWRASRTDPWEEPVNLGPGINTVGGEWAPCLSSDGSMLCFESGRPGRHESMRPWHIDIWQVPVIEMKKVNGLMF
jgi:hypothetical protein